MKVESAPIEGLLVITPDVWTDQRGTLFEAWHDERYAAAGITAAFVQDNVSLSAKRVIRGLHTQSAPHQQGKLVTVPLGAIFDVAVDLRPGSQTFGQFFSTELSAGTRRQLWIPAGFAHGFQVVSEQALVQYKCTAHHAPSHDVSICWDDPDLGISWPLPHPVVSARDAAGQRFRDVAARFGRPDWSPQ